MLASVHAASVTDSVQRAMDLFPPEEQQHARTVLAEVLQGVVSQRLVPSLVSERRTLILEIAVATPRIRQAIRDSDKTSDLAGIIQDGEFYGMFSLQRNAVRRVLANEVSQEAAERVVTLLSDL